MTINEIIKKSFETIKREGKSITPDYYASVFCNEAKKAGVSVEDCNKIAKYIENIDTSLKNEIKSYRIDTEAKLFRFLVAKIARSQGSASSKTLDLQSQFLYSLLEALATLASDEMRPEIVKLHKNLIESPNADAVQNLYNRWRELASKLSNKQADSKVESSELDELSSVIIKALKPSISNRIDSKIQSVTETLTNEPSAIQNKAILSQIEDAVKERILLDKLNVENMTSNLSSILQKTSHQYHAAIKNNNASSDQISEVKGQLDRIEKPSGDQIQDTQAKLISIATNLHKQSSTISSNLSEQNLKVMELSAKVTILEQELKAAQKDSQEDYLTKLFNRRAIDSFLANKEADYKRYQRDFAIALFDIDHFKQINDTYGHDAGDAVIKSVAQMIKTHFRESDIAGRFGGEEFIVIMPECDIAGVIKHADNVRDKIMKSKFRYSGKQVDVTISGGVTLRSLNSSLMHTLVKADECLYAAKEQGRNRVLSES